MRKNRHNGNLAQRRWLNRHLIWPQRKVNRLLIEHDKIMYLAVTKLRQFGASPSVFALATRLYRQLKIEINNNTNK